ncbi:hypothetical protein B0J18DRAFT_276144 [Chaetomium sp. MPI-SDFR-AT-0129]|nr:hypothetical protein B0J18DRAFT_276144 [Chaetomium sp. MPI-SDFR-AT-0129]
MSIMRLPLLTLALSPLSLALPATTDSPFPVPWVTVDDHGSATTITPAVISTEGHLTTISAAPDNLLYTTTYTLSPGTGEPSTYTGLPPVATATGAEEGSLAGAFPACGPEANVGEVEPFCLPRGGSRLFPGRTYYITWSPSYFPPDTQLTLQIFFTNSSSDPSTNTGTDTDTDPINDTLGTPGLSIPSLSSSTGFYPWRIPPDFLTTHNIPADQSLTLTFALSYHSSNTNTSPVCALYRLSFVVSNN